MRIIIAAIALIYFSSAYANDFLKADDKLNQLYKVYLLHLDDKQKRQFKSAQSAWVKFKEQDCSFHASGVEGGTVQAEVISACLLDRTNTRIKQLEYLLTCQEGDLSCPDW